EQMNNLDNKQRIYAFVKNNPGAHLRRISKELGIALGDIQYQLNQLEITNRIRSRRIGLYKTYYTISISGERNEKISAFLQQETPRDIILYLIENPGATNNQIAHHKGFSSTAPTINWHMSRLIQTGIVSSQRDGRYTKYHLKGNIKDIVDLLKSYHPSVWSKLSFRLAEIFVDLTDKSKPERDDENPVLNDKNDHLVLNDDKNEHTSYEVGKGGENKDSICNKIQL
ncbi:MAG: winged helix-turn-helix transcriptional regulator, partial [Candidatus Nitrosopolaris sp.]